MTYLVGVFANPEDNILVVQYAVIFFLPKP